MNFIILQLSSADIRARLDWDDDAAEAALIELVMAGFYRDYPGMTWETRL